MRGLLIALLLVAACAQPQLAPVPGAPSVTPEPAEPQPARPPSAPSTYKPVEDRPAEPAPQPYAFLNTETHVTPQAQALIVGDERHPLLFGERVGELLPHLTAAELPGLRTSLPGEAFLRLDFDGGGELRYGEDPESELIGEHLYYDDEAPLLEYALLLHEAALPVFLGQEVELFGEQYLVTEAENRTLRLERPGRTLLLTDGSRLWVDGRRYADTHVSVDPWSVIVRYDAPDEIHLLPGIPLSAVLDAPLLNGADLVLEGLSDGDVAPFRLQSRDGRVQLEAVGAGGEDLDVDLAALVDGAVVLGGDHALSVEECGFCLAEEDRFFLGPRSGESYYMAFLGANSDGSEAYLQDRVTRERHVVRMRETTRTHDGAAVTEGAVSLGGTVFRCELAVGDDPVLKIERGREEVRLAYDWELAIDEDAVTLSSPPRSRYDDEEVVVTLVADGERILLEPEAELFETRRGERWLGATRRGALLDLDEAPDGPRGEELTITYPREVRSGVVSVTG